MFVFLCELLLLKSQSEEWDKESDVGTYLHIQSGYLSAPELRLHIIN